MIVAVLFFAIVLLGSLFSSTGSSQSGGSRQTSSEHPPEISHTANTHYGGYYPPPYQAMPSGPVYSPDKRYIWDGYNQRWIRNYENDRFGSLLVGIALAGLAYWIFSPYFQ